MKKLLAVILVLTMLLSLAACGGNGSTEVKQVETPTLTYLYNTSDAHKAIGEYIQGALAAVGITMNLENQEWMDNITSGEYDKYYDEMYQGH